AMPGLLDPVNQARGALETLCPHSRPPTRHHLSRPPALRVDTECHEAKLAWLRCQGLIINERPDHERHTDKDAGATVVPGLARTATRAGSRSRPAMSRGLRPIHNARGLR